MPKEELLHMTRLALFNGKRADSVNDFKEILRGCSASPYILELQRIALHPTLAHSLPCTRTWVAMHGISCYAW